MCIFLYDNTIYLSKIKCFYLKTLPITYFLNLDVKTFTTPTRSLYVRIIKHKF